MKNELILHTGPLGPAKRDETVKPDPAETWKPHDSNPDLEVNGRGQLRTKALAPPQPVWSFPLMADYLQYHPDVVLRTRHRVQLKGVVQPVWTSPFDPVAVAAAAASAAALLAQYLDRTIPRVKL